MESDKFFKPKFAWIKMLDRVTQVAFDTETTGLNHWDPNYRTNGFSLCVKIDGSYYKEYIPLTHERSINADPEWVQKLMEKIAEKVVIIHNVNFDRRNIHKQYGVYFKRIMDTAKLSHLWDENWGMTADGNTRIARSLDNLAMDLLGFGKTKDPMFEAALKIFGWEGISYDEIKEYGADDAYVLFRLYEELIKRIKRNDELREAMDYWINFDAPNYDALYNMKSRGVAINVTAARTWETLSVIRMEELIEELGFDPAKSTQLRKVLWEDLGLPVIYNEKRNKVTGEVTRSPTTDKKAMEQYEEMLDLRPEMKDNPIARNILAFRGWSKACSSYYRPYQNLLSPDGRLRPDYKMHGTVTGRYACSEPNLQQIPKESDKEWNGEVKQLFKPADGHELWEYDYSQLEFRLNAHFAKEPFLLEVFNDHDRDIFTEMSKQLGWTRQQTKGFTYSTLYGAGKGRIANVFGVDEDKAVELIDDFYDRFPSLRVMSNKIARIAEMSGRIQLWSGRYRHIPNRKDSFKAANSFIQGGAADIVKHVMNRINREIPELRMLLQVHDSLVFEIPTEKLDYYQERIVNIMTNPTEDFGMTWDVEFKVDGHVLGEG